MSKSHKADLDPKVAMPILVRLHARLGAQIFENRKQAARLAASMKQVEAVIRMLEPGFNLKHIAARRRYKKNPWFKRGECFKRALDVLRVVEKPLTSREIVIHMLRERGISDPPRKTIRDMVGAVHASLRNHQGRSVIAHADTMPVRWSI